MTNSHNRERTRKSRTVAGIFLAVAGAALLVVLFTGLADRLKDAGGMALVLLFGLRALACWAVIGGAWMAYKAWNRINQAS
ncbi:hypothetical protein ABZ738_28115 [Micromonospora sp. NPDC047793]|uniref:hypothetical protein n=1 Tax=unclassified Micromonospora TaxID=2617518 RepID=UPI0010340377|nr:hypothetical protein [Verrucosispora sp. SN26_14.1]TBL45452.1 hypothetical protein EYA84_00300 [Verrucosispora sp. SN26_14.1]